MNINSYSGYICKAKHKFFAFTENVEREVVTTKADYVVPTFDEFLYVSKLPMSVSYPKNRIEDVKRMLDVLE